MTQTSRFDEAERYASYLRTPAGRLRAELASETLRPFLDGGSATRRALDAGCGTGAAAIRLACAGFDVVALDNCEEMLTFAERDAASLGVGRRVSWLRADIRSVAQLFDGARFDLVLCHNLLEYVEDPAAVVSALARLLRNRGLLSVLVRNRAGEVMQAALKSADCRAAVARLSSVTVVEPLFGRPVRVFDLPEVRAIARSAGLDVVVERGIRVVSDYLAPEICATEEGYADVFDMERALGARAEFAAIARYIQVVARRHEQ